MEIQFETDIIHWRGPSPFFFAPLPPGCAEKVRAVASRVSYGWGVIPVSATLNDLSFTTSLIPRDSTYLLPLKVIVRQKTGVTAGDRISVSMTIQTNAG